MDLTKRYIIMSEKAFELQTGAAPIHVMDSRETFVWDGDEVWFHYAVGEGKDMIIRKVRLYRQDQLQEMVKSKLATWQLTQKFWNWLWTKESVTTGLSMEQLWLSFVMKELHSKVWNGTEWIVQTETEAGKE